MNTLSIALAILTLTFSNENLIAVTEKGNFEFSKDEFNLETANSYYCTAYNRIRSIESYLMADASICTEIEKRLLKTA